MTNQVNDPRHAGGVEDLLVAGSSHSEQCTPSLRGQPQRGRSPEAPGVTCLVQSSSHRRGCCPTTFFGTMQTQLSLTAFTVIAFRTEVDVPSHCTPPLNSAGPNRCYGFNAAIQSRYAKTESAGSVPGLHRTTNRWPPRAGAKGISQLVLRPSPGYPLTPQTRNSGCGSAAGPFSPKRTACKVLSGPR